ncbi:MAG: two-component regulator propeller domain-containing protein [Blastocatellia bacterium]
MDRAAGIAAKHSSGNNQNRDGYLWFGTLAGAARLDGARFTVFDSSNTSEIKGSYITALVEDMAGTLWMGVDGGGLVRFREGRFSVYTKANGLPEKGRLRTTCVLIRSTGWDLAAP